MASKYWDGMSGNLHSFEERLGATMVDSVAENGVWTREQVEWRDEASNEKQVLFVNRMLQRPRMREDSDAPDEHVDGVAFAQMVPSCTDSRQHRHYSTKRNVDVARRVYRAQQVRECRWDCDVCVGSWEEVLESGATHNSREQPGSDAQKANVRGRRQVSQQMRLKKAVH